MTALCRNMPSQPTILKGHTDGVSAFSVWGQDVISIARNKIGLSSLSKSSDDVTNSRLVTISCQFFFIFFTCNYSLPISTGWAAGRYMSKTLHGRSWSKKLFSVIKHKHFTLLKIVSCWNRRWLLKNMLLIQLCQRGPLILLETIL